jgi:AAA domain-containing protein/IclR-like helix-turn-helix domain-containing protein
MSALRFDGLIPAAELLTGGRERAFVEEEIATRPALPLYPFGPKLQAVNLADFVAEPLPQRQHVMAPILPERGLAMLFAARGVGKTQIAVNMAWAVACGQPFLRWYAPKPRAVLYIDGEMPQELLQDRAKAMISPSACGPPHPDFFRLLSMDRQELGTSLNLALHDHQAAVEALLDNVDLLILDNISTLVNSGRENDAESWNEMQDWLLNLRRLGKTVLLIHHSGRGGNARGTSKREDVLDIIIHLKHPEDYEPEDGARFEVHLTKARGVHGDDALPFEARLDVIDNRDRWTTHTLRDKVLDQIQELSRAGGTVRDIAEETGLSKSKVQRLQAKLRAEGRL